MRRPYEDVAKDFLALFHPEADCAIVGGSITRGEGTSTSDIDIVVLYDDNYQTPHRDSLFFQDWIIESFVHTPKAQDYFLEKDRSSGLAVMIDLVAHGQLIGPRPDLGNIQQQKARAIFDAGPPPYTQDDFEKGRYSVTDQLDDLVGNTKPDELIAVLTRLYYGLNEFYLRANNQWRGNGKWMMRRMRKFNSVFAARYDAAFREAFAGKLDSVRTLTQEVLAPYGGELREWKAFAPDDWKKFGS